MMEPPHGGDDAAPRDGSSDPQSGGDGHEEDDVWRSFEQSVAYMRDLAALYEEAFLTTKRAAVTAAHVESATRHASEAIELLGSNLLNAAGAIVANIESQEEQLLAMGTKLDGVKRRLREQDKAREQEEIDRFFDPYESRKTMGKAATQAGPLPQGTPMLRLSGSAAHASSSTASPYLYL